jgi:hypothetical protein
VVSPPGFFNEGATMKKAVWLLGILILGVISVGCNSQGCSQPQERKGEQKAGSDIDKNLALKFLQAIQDGDKNKMYEATNLTTDIVNDSREKLIHSKQHKLTEQQRTEFEHALRISGQIDFFIAKIRTMFPKSSRLEIMQTTAEGSTDDIKHSVHLVKITYMNKNEAMRDKTGKFVKEMVVHLQQLTRSVSGRSIHEFSFSSKDFEKIADKDFEVLSYF